MTASDPRELAREELEQAVAALRTEAYGLTLFVSGASASSAHAVANVREICDAYLEGRYQLDIVDLHQEPALAAKHHVLATPTLIKDRPSPIRMLVGDMSNRARFLAALDIRVPPTSIVEGTPDTQEPVDR